MRRLFHILMLFGAFAAPTAWAACPNPIPKDTACLTWVAPIKNTDGSDILPTGPTSLASFAIYWGFSSGDFDGTRRIGVTDPNLTEFTPPSGTITIPRPPGGGNVDVFFTITATNVEGVESNQADETKVTVTFDAREPNEPVLIEVLINVASS